MSVKFETEAHVNEQDIFWDINTAETGLQKSAIKRRFRLLKRFVLSKIHKKKKKFFKQILYVSSGKVPADYIDAFQKQYPDKTISVIIPLLRKPCGKYVFNFEYFLQNRTNQAGLYKLPKKRNNIPVWGVYSPVFENMKDVSEFSRLFYLAHYVKCVRISASKLKPDVIHSDNVPIYLGADFESIKFNVVQIINDFTFFEKNKYEPFWAVINLGDKRGMKRLCRDKIIKKCIASLFNLHNTRKFYQMRECLEFIYKNYFKFRKYIDKCEDIEENILFNRMNARVLQLFPQMAYENDAYYNPIYYTIKKADSWAVISETYYKDIFENPELTGKMFKVLKKTKSDFVSYGTVLEKHLIYQPFDSDNFRDLRGRNKKYLVKEFYSEKIKTRFVDRTLFKNDNYTIKGYLDSFYEAPLIFGTYSDIYAEGADIAFGTLLKLFELNRNIQIIINVEDGLKNNYVKSFAEFLEKTSSLNGRWVFIDGEINKPQFLSSADMILLPSRINPSGTLHYEAMKYGCIPIASKTGIYNDTIADIFDDMVEGCGLKAKKDDGENFGLVLNKALSLYSKNPASWNLLIKNAMNYDSGWNFEIIEKYNKIYEDL